MDVLLTALLGIILGWYLRHVLAGSKLAPLESRLAKPSPGWSAERDSLIAKAADLSRRSAELDVELGTTTAQFTRQIEQAERDHAQEVSALTERIAALEGERREIGLQLADVAKWSAAVDGELRAALTRHRSRYAQHQEDLLQLHRLVAAAKQERDAATQRLAELAASSAKLETQWEGRLSDLQASLSAAERERERGRQHVSELTRRAAATEANLHVPVSGLEKQLRALTPPRREREGVRPTPGAREGLERLPAQLDGLAAQAASVLSVWQKRTQRLDGQIHDLLGRSKAHHARYQKHVDAIRHELALSQERLALTQASGLGPQT